MDHFDLWMRNVVKSIHYSDNKAIPKRTKEYNKMRLTTLK